MAAACRADPSLVGAMTMEDPGRAVPHAGQVTGVPGGGTVARGVVPCRLIGGTGA